MIICRQNKHTFVLFTLENILVSPRALRPLVRDYKYSAGSPNWFSQFRDRVEFMSERGRKDKRGLFRRRWIKVCGAIEKTAADLGLNPSDEENVANVLSMSPPKSAGKREARSPSRTPPRSTERRGARSPPKTPPASTSTAPTPPRLASFSQRPTGTRQKSTTVPPPLVGKVKSETDVNNNAGVAAKSVDPPDVSQFCHIKTSLDGFVNFGKATFFRTLF